MYIQRTATKINSLDPMTHRCRLLASQHINKHQYETDAVCKNGISLENM